MKRILFTVALLMAFSLAGFAQGQTRPGGAQVGGLQSDNVSAAAILVDANGVVQVNPTAGAATSVSQGTAGTTPWPVTLSNGAYVTDYTGTGATVTTLALSSGTTVMTTATVDVQEIRCNNFTASTVYIAMTDTAGNLFTGEATAKLGFAIPAYAEDYPIAAGSHIKMVGIKMYAGTGSAVNCVIYGKQP